MRFYLPTENLTEWSLARPWSTFPCVQFGCWCNASHEQAESCVMYNTYTMIETIALLMIIRLEVDGDILRIQTTELVSYSSVTRLVRSWVSGRESTFYSQSCNNSTIFHQSSVTSARRLQGWTGGERVLLSELHFLHFLHIDIDVEKKAGICREVAKHLICWTYVMR